MATMAPIGTRQKERLRASHQASGVPMIKRIIVTVVARRAVSHSASQAMPSATIIWLAVAKLGENDLAIIALHEGKERVNCAVICV